jgi:endoglucanase Acf2
MTFADLLPFLPACVVIAIIARGTVKDEDVKRLSSIRENTSSIIETNSRIKETLSRIKEDRAKTEEALTKMEEAIELLKLTRMFRHTRQK